MLIKQNDSEATMKTGGSADNLGLKRLIKQYRREFRVPENIDHYAPADFRAAERKFIKYALKTGR